MPRTIPLTAPLLTALLLLGACAPAPRHLPLPLAPEPVAAEPEELGEGPEIDDAAAAAVGRDLLGGVAYDLPLEANTWVEAELDFLVGQRAAVIGRWLERGDFYEPFIKTVLAEHGLPTDLYHLAMIESGFIPNARSRAGAVGLWQFMPATARLEGLRVDAQVDERMDPVRSTRAAARHLSRLHRSFAGDWALAAAAYNAGAGRISRGLQGFGASNFWELAIWGDLAEETKHYVPRLYAMTIIARDRERFGFAAPALRASFEFDSVHVDLATPLAELAEIGGVPLDELTRLNPHLLQGTTPPGSYTVWVPAGTGARVQQAFLESDFRRDGGFASYTVRRGDTLGRLAQLSGLPSSRIRELNPGTNWDRLQIGHKLRLPAGAARALAARAAEPTAPRSAGPATERAAPRPATAVATSGSPSAGAAAGEHTVRPGETLWSIARQHGVSVAALQAANELSGSTIVPGRKLRIPGKAAQAGAGGGLPTAIEVAHHVVKPGETLWSIAREYSSSVAAIQEANRIGDSVIVPGQKLLIPR